MSCQDECHHLHYKALTIEQRRNLDNLLAFVLQQSGIAYAHDVMADNDCERCFVNHLNGYLTQVIEQSSVNENLELAKSFARKKDLIEQLDYYIENGFYVFTKWFHLKRGECCKNRCRHCPYGTFDQQ